MMSRQSNTLAQRGFGLVEIMVGLIIGLIGMLVVMQVYSASEGQKRSTTSGSDALSSGLVALYTPLREARQAGYGLSALNALGCRVRAYNANRVPADFTFPAMAPVIINPVNIPAGDANSDVVMMTYGNSDGYLDGVKFTPKPAALDEFRVQNRSGFRIGNLVMVVEPGLDCTIAQVTNLPASGLCGDVAGIANEVGHNDGTYMDPASGCAAVPSTFNKPGGLGVIYTNGTLYDLGPSPTSVVYAVRNQTLTVCDFMAQDCTDPGKTGDPAVWMPAASHIVSLQAQYGRDTTPITDGVVDLFNKTTPAVALAPPTLGCQWARISAAKLAVLARGTHYDKAVVTTTMPTWSGGIFDTTAVADWDHYRYQVYESVLPLRNVVWMGPQPPPC
ncbi:MAG: PilW family protein [Burkholderiales bacterium]